ncbi:efflux RND transporter permease subunit [Microbacterium sp. NEAU-LLC]|uniref:Efflux RND transporter permease subunit n=1 Tax=Microbacterium helvum TaxID=2773713 RepID=A0ABR8NLI3_9MICO|nr:efflux RND transporter permease subunit [Microbacterium helvum]
MSNLAVLSLKNRALIALITIVAAIFGGLALTNLKQELIPSIEFPALIVVSTYPGASPDVVNNDVSTPIESAIQGVPGLEGTTATSTTNASIVQATFAYGTDLATAEQKMTQAINRIQSTLPTGVEPNVLSVSIDDLPVIQIAVTGYDDEETIQAQLEASVIPDLEDVDGVNAAQIVGGVGQRVTITPDQAALAAAGYSQQAISDALKQNGVLFPGGEITENDQTLTVQTGSKITSVDEIAALPLVPSDAEQFAGGQKTIGDVATVVQETDPVTSISRVNGEPALTIAVTKLPSANTVDVSRGVTALLPSLEDDIDGVEFTVVFDQAPYIQQSIDSLAQEGLLGLVFAVIVIFLFLLSVRSTLVAAISIPTSVLITFIGIQAFGFSLNILTLGALTIAIGRVVDDSIVVIENIKRHYVGDADKKTAILRGVREVATAISASTITTVAVFLPIAFVGDVTGELFRPFAMTVTIAMLASLFVALTIVPVLAYWFLKPGKPILTSEGVAIDPEDPAAPPSRLQKSYLPILTWTLKHSWVTLLIAVLVLGGTIAMAPFMKTNFLGDSGQNTFTVTQDLGPAPSLESEDAAAQPVEEALLGIDGIETVQVSIGSSGSALRDAFSGGSAGITYSITTDPDADQVALREDVQQALADLDDVGTLTVGTGNGGFGSSDIEVDVTAPDSETLADATDTVVDAVTGADGVGQVSSNLSASLPYIAVEVDRDKAAQLGLSEVAVGGLVSAAMQPQQGGTVEIDDTTLTVYIAASDPPASLDELRALPVPSATGLVTLSDVATVEESTGPASITTEDGRRTATVTVSPSTDDLATATASVTQAIADAELPKSADAAIGGVASQQGDAFSQLGLAMLAAILIVYIVMVATFRSLRQPLLLLVSVPFAATGAILLQIITGVPLGVASLIGVLMLIGIVVTNAIVLVDLVNQYREKGLSTHDATLAGGSRRLRPILMTALATIFALTPMALGITGHGGFISQPLAIVVIGGLISSTVLTLLVLPTLYNLVEGAKERRAARRRGGDGPGDGGGPGGGGDGPAPEGEGSDGADAGDDREGELVAVGASGAAAAAAGDEGGAGGAAAAGAAGAAVFETRRERRAREAAGRRKGAVAAETAATAVPVIEEGPDVEVSSTQPAPDAVAGEAGVEAMADGPELEASPAEATPDAAATVSDERAVESTSAEGEPEAGAAESAAADVPEAEASEVEASEVEASEVESSEASPMDAAEPASDEAAAAPSAAESVESVAADTAEAAETTDAEPQDTSEEPAVVESAVEAAEDGAAEDASVDEAGVEEAAAEEPADEAADATETADDEGSADAAGQAEPGEPGEPAEAQESEAPAEPEGAEVPAASEVPAEPEGAEVPAETEPAAPTDGPELEAAVDESEPQSESNVREDESAATADAGSDEESEHPEQADPQQADHDQPEPDDTAKPERRDDA